MSDVLLPSDLDYDDLEESLRDEGVSYTQVAREDFLEELTTGDYTTVVGNNHEQMYAATVEYDSDMHIMDLADSSLATSYLSGNSEADASSIGEITQLAQDNREMKERIDFAASAFSHDARNELNVMMGRLELAREKADDEVDRHLELVENSSYALEDLVDSAKSVMTDEERQNLPVAQVVEKVYSNYQKEAERRGFDFEVEAENGVYALAGCDIQNMYGQMVRNSFEHSGGDHIRIIADEVEGRPRVVYEDNGTGIRDERKQKVLEEGVTENESGGLGMFIMAKTADKHNIDLEVDDSEDLGGVKISTLLEPADQ